MNTGPLIIVPRMIPPGERVHAGQKTDLPCCDRCRRESTARNPIMLSERKSHSQREHARGLIRRDAICAECREAMAKGRL